MSLSLPSTTIKSSLKGVESSHTYYVSPLGAWQTLDLLPLVTRLTAPLMNGLAALLKGDDVGAAAIAEGLEKSLSGSIGRLTREELRLLTNTMFAGARVELDGKLVAVLEVFDEHFKSRPFAMVQLLTFALRENYGDFSDALTKLAAQLDKVLPKPAPMASVIPDKTKG